MKFNIQDLRLKLSKKNIFLISVLVIFFISLFWLIGTNLWSNSSLNQNSSEDQQEDSIVARIPNQIPITPYIIPVGTQMMIPPWVMQQYQLSEQQAIYENALNFLIYNYGVAAPSASNEGQDTYYVPLNVYSSSIDDGDYDDYTDSGYYGNTVMMDVTHLTVDDTPVAQPVEPPAVQQEVQQPAQPSADQPPAQPSADQPPAVQQDTQQPVEPVQPPAVQQDVQQPAAQPPAVQQDAQQPVQPADQPPAVQQEMQQQPAQPSADQPPVQPSVPSTKPAETAIAKPKPVLVTTKPTNIYNTPPVPDPIVEPDLSKTYPATCDKVEEEKTEASAICTDSSCMGLDKGKTGTFLDKVSTNVQNANRKKNFPSIVKVFCRSCYGVDVNDFFQYIEERAKDQKVPPAIMFAFMLRESNGDCDAGGDRYKSFGLFQLNITNSTKLKPCEGNELSDLSPQQMENVCVKGEYRTEGYTKAKGRCLNNPYCNFEESFNLLKDEKWKMVNGNEAKPTKTSWVEMKDTERNLWRDAIIAYNGAGYLKSAERRMKDRGLYSHLDNWEVKRMFFVKSYLYNKSKHEQCGESEKYCYTECENTGDKEKCNEECKKSGRRCRAKYNPQKIIHNLAYVERITGRETKGGLVNSSMCQWIQFRKNNPKVSCK